MLNISMILAVLIISMLLAVSNMQHEFLCVNYGLRTESLIIYPFSNDFLCHITALLLRMFIFLQLLPQLIALEFPIRQILQPAGTPLFLASPVRHAELEQEDHWHYTVDRKRL